MGELDPYDPELEDSGVSKLQIEEMNRKEGVDVEAKVEAEVGAWVKASPWVFKKRKPKSKGIYNFSGDEWNDQSPSNMREVEVGAIQGSQLAKELELVPITSEDRRINIGTKMGTEQKESLIKFLRQNADIFAWSHKDMPRLILM